MTDCCGNPMYRVKWCDGSCQRGTPTFKCEVRDQYVRMDDVEALNTLIREIVADDMLLLGVES